MIDIMRYAPNALAASAKAYRQASLQSPRTLLAGDSVAGVDLPLAVGRSPTPELDHQEIFAAGGE